MTKPQHLILSRWFLWWLAFDVEPKFSGFFCKMTLIWIFSSRSVYIFRVVCDWFQYLCRRGAFKGNKIHAAAHVIRSFNIWLWKWFLNKWVSCLRDLFHFLFSSLLFYCRHVKVLLLICTFTEFIFSFLFSRTKQNYFMLVQGQRVGDGIRYHVGVL